MTKRRVKILSKEKLLSYSPGDGCICHAACECECACLYVDWTPREVYELRLRVKNLERSRTR